MLLKKITLQNFRNYKAQSFIFDRTNVIIGKNTAGKTNIVESICYLSNGKSFRAENEIDSVMENLEFSRIEGEILDGQDKINLQVLLQITNNRLFKKYMINGIPKRQMDFASTIITSLFSPADIEIITDSPGLRRKYLDFILCQAEKRYRYSLSIYEKALRARNKMLYLVREGKRIFQKGEFEYWDNLLIENGAVITDTRNNFIEFINSSLKNIFDFNIFYDKSLINRERLDKYSYAEQQTGTTLVGPQRDELVFLFPDSSSSTRHSELVSESLEDKEIPKLIRNDVKNTKTIKEFGSRGEQRLTIFQMKLLEIEYLKQKTGKTPILLLDDIFSELDNNNIHKILELIGSSQTIITTTHKEFVPQKIAKEVNIIDLNSQHKAVIINSKNTI